MSGQKPESLGKKVSFLGRRFHKKIERKYPKLKGKYTYEEWRKVRDDFWNLVGDIYINQSNGIVLDGIGYFSFPAYTKRPRHKYTNKSTISSDGLIYYPQSFCRVFHNTMFHPFSFQLNRKFKREFNQLVYDGMKYYHHYSLVKSLVKTKFKHVSNNRRVPSRAKSN